MRRNKNSDIENTLIIKQGGIDPITGEKLIQININGKRMEISLCTDYAHIEAVSKNGPRYNNEKEAEKEENIIILRPTTHRNIDKDNKENYSVEELQKSKEDICEYTNDENVYKYLSSCDCSYIYRKK